MSIQESKEALKQAKGFATEMLKVLDGCTTKKQLSNILKTHLALILRALDPNENSEILDIIGSGPMSNIVESTEMMREFLSAWEETNDIPTIAHHIAVARHEYLHGMFKAMEADVENGDISLRMDTSEFSGHLMVGRIDND